jgi:hypothetical protein
MTLSIKKKDNVNFRDEETKVPYSKNKISNGPP